MDKKTRARILRELAKMEHGEALKNYIIEQLIEFNNLENIIDFDTFRARREAKILLIKIFRFLNITEAQIKKEAKNQYL